MTDVDAILERAGLDPKPAPDPMKYPRIVDENGDQLWIRCQVDGIDREVDITIGQAWGMVMTLLAWLAKAGRR